MLTSAEAMTSKNRNVKPHFGNPKTSSLKLLTD